MKKPVREYQGKELLAVLPERLPAWYGKNHRTLPWRDTGNPYDVWLSEIMLQQTRVAAVIDYFYRFKEALPGIPELASCEETRLMKLWEGLGYYSRVRNLQKAAQIVVRDHGGKLPETAKELQKLPGIGPYTAGAIASIAFGEAVPAVDGNVLRICSRICGNREDIALPETKKALGRALSDLFQRVCGSDLHPGTMNQAMMELGATVCVPNGSPQCAVCPAADRCRAYLSGETEMLPLKSAGRPRRIERHTILVLMDGGNVLIRKRPGKGLLAGLWELPSAEGYLTEVQALAEAKRLLEEAARISGTDPAEPVFVRKLPPARHVFTHIEWEMQGYLIRVVPALGAAGNRSGRSESDKMKRTEAGTPGFAQKVLSGEEDCRLPVIFADPEELQTVYALPSAFSAYRP